MAQSKKSGGSLTERIGSRCANRLVSVSKRSASISVRLQKAILLNRKYLEELADKLESHIDNAERVVEDMEKYATALGK